MSEPRPDTDESRTRAIGIAAEMMGELVEFWGFKGSMGRIWTTLYLSPVPLTADTIASRTGLSSGAVSMALADLLQWGVIEREPVPNQRKRYYRAKTEVWEIVRRIFRERELRLVRRAAERFQQAVDLIEALDDSEVDDETRFVAERLRGLLKLAHVGGRLIETLADIGQLTLHPIRGTLGHFLSRR